MKIKLIAVVFAVVILAGGYYFYTSSDGYISKYGRTEYVNGTKVERVGQLTQFDRKTRGRIAAAEGGWSQYMTTDWDGFQFSFPSQWTVTEKEFNTEVVSTGGLATVEVKGDGYTVYFTKIGKDLDTSASTYSTPETLSGHEIVFYREKGYPAFTAVIKDCRGIGGVLVSRSGERAITDKIVSSVKCSK